MPMVPKGKSIGPHFGTWMLSVNSFSKNKEWAYRAIKWFTSAATQTKALAQQLHPTRASVYATPPPRIPAISAKFGNFYEVLGKSLAVGVGRPRLTNYGDVDRAVWVAVNNAARGAATPEAALKGAAGEVRELLEAGGLQGAMTARGRDRRTGARRRGGLRLSRDGDRLGAAMSPALLLLAAMAVAPTIYLVYVTLPPREPARAGLALCRVRRISPACSRDRGHLVGRALDACSSSCFPSRSRWRSGSGSPCC